MADGSTTLVALAALAATSAFAQSNVTLYGIIDVGYQSTTQTNEAKTAYIKQNGVGSGQWAGSRIGFRGTEDLGGGTSANFVFEQGIEPTTGDGFNYRNGGSDAQINKSATSSSSGGSNRQSWVGLKTAKLGEVRAGYVYAPSYDMYTNTGHINAEMTGNRQATFALAQRIRGISYFYDAMPNLQLNVVTGGIGSDMTSTTSTLEQVNGYKELDAKYTAVRAMWTQGAARIGATAEQANKRCAVGTASVANVYGADVKPATCTATTAFKESTTLLQAGYNFGVADVGFIYGKKKLDGNYNVTKFGTGEGNLKQAMVKVPFAGTWEVRGTYFKSDLSYSVQDAGKKYEDMTGKYVAVSNALSKRTRIYAAYGTSTDQGTQTAALAVAAGTPSAYKNTKSIVGLVHSF